MARREDIETSIWTEPPFDELSPKATLLYLWSFTNPRCGMGGIYKVSRRAMTESKVAARDIDAALNELAEARFAYYVDDVLWVRSRVKHLRTRTKQIAKAIELDLRRLGSHPLVAAFLDEYRSLPWPDLQVNLTDVRVNLTTPDNTGESVNVTRTSPEVLRQRHGQLQGSGQGKERQTQTSEGELPRDFPDELRPHFAIALPKLQDLASRHGANEVVARAVAAVMSEPSRRHKPFVKAVHDFVAWMDSHPDGRKDMVASYRNWLDRDRTNLAGVERIAPPGNVVPHPSSGRFSEYDRAAGL